MEARSLPIIEGNRGRRQWLKDRGGEEDTIRLAMGSFMGMSISLFVNGLHNNSRLASIKFNRE